MQMLVPVALEEFFNAFPLVSPHLDQGRVRACRIHMLLSFRGRTESAAGYVNSQS
jgi:hypothetical protein